jgi:predicted anti-sigma-YlaC factor YlaD
MSRIDCEQSRDLLPLLTRGQLLAADVTAVQAHLAECAGCRQESGIVETLAAVAEDVPAGLESRVLVAVRRPVRRTAWPVTRVAMAAALAAAVLGGSMIFERWRSLPTPEAGGALLVLEEAAPQVSWGLAHDPLLQNGSSLATLSVEELELILEELDS